MLSGRFRTALVLVCAVGALAACGKPEPETLLAQARADYAKGDHRSAIVLAKVVLEAQPERADARLLLGRALLAAGDTPLAVVELAKARDLGTPLDEVVPALAMATARSVGARRMVGEFGGIQLAQPRAVAELKTTLAAAHIGLQNVAKAEALLKEAGWEDRDGDGKLEDKFGSPMKFQYTYASGGEIAERVARFVKDAYLAIGIEVEIRPVEWAVYTDLLKTRDFDAITLGWGASAPESDPIQIFHSSSIKNQGDNFAQWNSPDADRLIDAGRRELNFDKRMAIWRELEAVIHREQPYTFVRVPPWLRFAATDLGNVVAYPKGLEPTEYFRGSASTPAPMN